MGTEERSMLYRPHSRGGAVNQDADLKRFYQRKLVQKGMGKARVAAARKLGIRFLSAGPQSTSRNGYMIYL